MTYDLVIIGGGPAGVAAAVYAARKQLKTAVVAEEVGGQSAVSADIHNWIGTPSISGSDLASSFNAHLHAYEHDLDLFLGDRAEKVADGGELLTVTTRDGKVFSTRYIFLASGSHHRKLGVPGEAELNGRGVVYCATCDAPLFRDRDVIVVGTGNAGLEAVIDLLPYAKQIHLFNRSGAVRGDAVTAEKVLASDKVTHHTNVQITSVLGDMSVSGVRYTDALGATQELAVQGVFVEIGADPNSDIVADLVTLNERREVVVDHKTQQSSHPRVYAAGDVSDVLYKQNNISAGDAVKAILSIYAKLH